jgi:hypothetical protein
MHVALVVQLHPAPHPAVQLLHLFHSCECYTRVQVGERCVHDLGALLLATSPAAFPCMFCSVQACSRCPANLATVQAQLGLRHPRSGVEEGWAWVNIGASCEERDGAAAHAMSDFVARTLVQIEGREPGVERTADGTIRTLPSVIEQNPQLGDTSSSHSCLLMDSARVFWWKPAPLVPKHHR